MTLRARLAALTSGAVALAILAAAVAAWFLIRGTLMDDVDQRLLDRVPDLEGISVMTIVTESGEPVTGDPMTILQNDLIGIQHVEPGGSIQAAVAPGDVTFDFHPDEARLFDDDPGDPLLRTENVDGASYRVMSVAFDEETFIRMVFPLDNVESTLTRMAWLLVGVAGVGMAIAGGLGWFIVRAGLRPVDKLAAAAEQVAATKDLAQRIEVDGSKRDEIARLSSSVNAMLAALDGAKIQQRQLVEDAGHELRTPLATLRNDIGVLLRAEQHPERTMPADDRAGLLRDLESEAVVLSDLVRELVDLSRGETEPEPLLETDLRALVDRAVVRNRRVNPEVSVAVRGDSFEATVRPAMLERAIANLVRNAVQVSPDGGLVEVELAESGLGENGLSENALGAKPPGADRLDTVDGWAVVRVLDRGAGINDADLPRLFDRFYRGADARERPGSGLGLAIVAQAAEQHGGHVDAENRPAGGALFTLRVPARALR